MKHGTRKGSAARVAVGICLSFLLGLALMVTISAATPVSYRTCDENGANWTTQSVTDYTIVTDSTQNWGADDGDPHWYVVDSQVTIRSRVTVTGDVRLILLDDCTLTTVQGIRVTGSNKLTVYTQSAGNRMGVLKAEAVNQEPCHAPIGGNSNEDGGVITINGGRITATLAAGCLGDPAGIGAGGYGNAGTITINGGWVHAEGSAGHGIGSGSGKTGGTVTIRGGYVRTNGIGAGGYNAKTDTFITGNAVVVCSGQINPNDQANWRGVIFNQSASGTLYGDSMTVTSAAEIPAGHTLTIPEGKTLRVGDGVPFRVQGTIHGDFTPGLLPRDLVLSQEIQIPYGQDPEAALSHQYTYAGDGTPEITWYADNNGTRGEPLATTPVYAGTYWFGVSLPATATHAAETGYASFTIVKLDLDAPAAPAWDDTVPEKATWQAVPDSSGYRVWLYCDGQACGDPVFTTDLFYIFHLPQLGTYTFTVMALGNDSGFGDSPASAFSDRIHAVSWETTHPVSGVVTARQIVAVHDGGVAVAPYPIPPVEHYDQIAPVWDYANTPITAPRTMKAFYVVNHYTVTFENGDGTPLDVQLLPYGHIPAYNGQTPVKAADPRYTYSFSGWTSSLVAVTGDVTYTPAFDRVVNCYTVTWKHENGRVLLEESLAWGEIPVYPGMTPIKPSTEAYSYEFAGWSPEVRAVNRDVTYTAQFRSGDNAYTVTWRNEDGTTLEVDENLPWGTTPRYDGTTPAKAETPFVTYTFAGWAPQVGQVTRDIVYTATFTATPKTATITWQNGDGSVLETSTVNMGDLPAYHGNTPQKAGDAQYTYTFAGWDQAIVAATGDTTYKATFASSVNVYTVTWMDEDGTLLRTQHLPFGTVPAYDGATPIKSATAQTSYAFKGWDQPLTAITDDTAFTATYAAIPNTLQVVFMADGQVIATQSVAYGGAAQPPAIPTKEGYTKTAPVWSAPTDKITANITIQAVYTPDPVAEPKGCRSLVVVPLVGLLPIAAAICLVSKSKEE